MSDIKLYPIVGGISSTKSFKDKNIWQEEGELFVEKRLLFIGKLFRSSNPSPRPSRFLWNTMANKKNLNIIAIRPLNERAKSPSFTSQ